MPTDESYTQGSYTQGSYTVGSTTMEGSTTLGSLTIGSSLQERKQPLTSTPRRSRKGMGLNKTLNTSYIDYKEKDTTCLAQLTRCMTSMVGCCFTPRTLLALLRLLKAITFAFLLFTIAADIMFIIFVNMRVSNVVNAKVGGTRDIIIRAYGIVLTAMAITIELDVYQVTKHFTGFKSFIPRSLLLIFIATITASSPLHKIANLNGSDNSANNYGGDDDDYYYKNQRDDDYNYNYNNYTNGSYTDQQVTNEIPGSTVIFQMVTSLTLGACGFVYFILGILCVDRLRSKAYVSSENPAHTTAIPSGHINSDSQTNSQSQSLSTVPDEVSRGIVA